MPAAESTTEGKQRDESGDHGRDGPEEATEQMKNLQRVATRLPAGMARQRTAMQSANDQRLRNCRSMTAIAALPFAFLRGEHFAGGVDGFQMHVETPQASDVLQHFVGMLI